MGTGIKIVIKNKNKLRTGTIWELQNYKDYFRLRNKI